jgi:hypothetical protein
VVEKGEKTDDDDKEDDNGHDYGGDGPGEETFSPVVWIEAEGARVVIVIVIVWLAEGREWGRAV